ncbi:MAG: cation transporter [Candidatus Saccharimonadales bacterium]
MITKTFKVPDMDCTACVMHLESIEDKLKGVEMIDANYRKQRMIVEYDETKVGEEAIIAAVKKEGYTAIPQEGEE